MHGQQQRRERERPVDDARVVFGDQIIPRRADIQIEAKIGVVVVAVSLMGIKAVRRESHPRQHATVQRKRPRHEVAVPTGLHHGGYGKAIRVVVGGNAEVRTILPRFEDRLRRREAQPEAGREIGADGVEARFGVLPIAKFRVVRRSVKHGQDRKMSQVQDALSFVVGIADFEPRSIQAGGIRRSNGQESPDCFAVGIREGEPELARTGGQNHGNQNVGEVSRSHRGAQAFQVRLALLPWMGGAGREGFRNALHRSRGQIHPHDRVGFVIVQRQQADVDDSFRAAIAQGPCDQRRHGPLHCQLPRKQGRFDVRFFCEDDFYGFIKLLGRRQGLDRRFPDRHRGLVVHVPLYDQRLSLGVVVNILQIASGRVFVRSVLAIAIDHLRPQRTELLALEVFLHRRVLQDNRRVCLKLLPRRPPRLHVKRQLRARKFDPGLGCCHSNLSLHRIVRLARKPFRASMRWEEQRDG